MVFEQSQKITLRVLVALNFAYFAANAVFGVYIIVRMLVPQRSRFVLLWLFYVVAILISLLQMALMVLLFIDPDSVKECFTYVIEPVSLIHMITGSLVISCGFIAIATMFQIRCSLRILLNELTIEQAKHRTVLNNTFCASFWFVNLCGVFILLFVFEDARRELQA